MISQQQQTTKKTRQINKQTNKNSSSSKMLKSHLEKPETSRHDRDSYLSSSIVGRLCTGKADLLISTQLVASVG